MNESQKALILRLRDLLKQAEIDVSITGNIHIGGMGAAIHLTSLATCSDFEESRELWFREVPVVAPWFREVPVVAPPPECFVTTTKNKLRRYK